MAELASGADIAVCGSSNTASSWLGDPTSGPALVLAAAEAPAEAATSATVNVRARADGSFVRPRSLGACITLDAV